MTSSRSIERVYAHFHRVLAELLTALTTEADVTWLAEPGHQLTDDHASNKYNPAVYAVPELSPYGPALSELEQVQAEALELTGRTKPGRNLLPPLAVDGASYIRLSRHTGQTGRTISREAGLRRLRQIEETTAQNLQEFEQYANRHDPARKQVESELKQLRKAIKLLAESRTERLRETYRQEVIRPYAYFRDGTSTQLHMRNTGLIAAGTNLQVEWSTGPRRERSDKIKLKPIAEAGPLRFFDQAAWDAAKVKE